MSRRDHPDRCATCQMVECLCALVPRLVTRTRLVLLVHYREARKPTTTGLLAARCLTNSEVHIVGDLARPLPPELHWPGERAALLYPDEDAVPIATVLPTVLVVPDGNWRQASKMRRRVPGLADLPCVGLPEGAATAYRLRAEPRVGGLATLEAIARAFAVLEGPTIEEAMLAVFRVMVERTLRLRGVSAR